MGQIGPYVWVYLGGGMGAVARYAVGLWITSRGGATTFPWHTLLINVTGSLLIGALLTLLLARTELDPAWRFLLVTGFLGGYTTFSSYSFEALTLARTGDWLRATWYVLGSNGAGLLACAAGMLLARLLIAERA
jgi:CrcB protein